MNKKFIAVICAALIICLSIPSVPVLADDFIVPGIVTSDSLDGYDFGLPLDSWTGGVEGSGAALSNFIKPSDCFPYSNSLFDQNNLTSALNKLSSLDIDLDNSYYMLTTNYGTLLTTLDLYVIPMSSDISDFIGMYQTYNGSSTGTGSNRCAMAFKSSDTTSTTYPFYHYYTAYSGGVWSNWTTAQTQFGRFSVDNQNTIFYYLFDGSVGYSYNLLYSNADFFFVNYLNWEKAYKDTNNNWVYPSYSFQQFCNFYFGLYSEYPKGSTGWFNLLNVPYYNGTEIVIPDTGSGEESNENHLFLKNFDIQFCKPYNLADVYSRAGGGYASFTYDFDSWINSHSSDYEIDIITQIDVDGNTYTYPNVRNLDVSGVLVLPFSGLAPSYPWSQENLLFVQYPNKIFGNYNLGYIYSLTYQKYVNNYNRFLGSGRSNRLFFKGFDIASDFDDVLGSQVEQLFSNITHTKFQISFTVTMVDTVSGERSGSYIKTFDLLNGVYNVTSNTIADNTNPFEYSDESPYLPVEDSGGGYLPSTNNNLVTNNINIPNDYTVTYRDGVNSFIDWYNQDSSVTGIQNTFWGSMGVFKGNPASELYSEYFGFLPDGFKSVIFGCAGIGIIGGALTVLRKRILK